jgi:hypothetical protein
MTPGFRLGPYEIIGSLGAGGMGEVYRAADTNLKRQVAIKVLPASVATDADRLTRFQREAEVLAALNHPNIAHIFGVEKSGGTFALAMELVEGPTLADRIARGAVPLDEAIPIAKQIADALESAHEQGIIHRDLKPANIKLRDDGTVKVLDFMWSVLTDGAGKIEPIPAQWDAYPGAVSSDARTLYYSAYQSNQAQEDLMSVVLGDAAAKPVVRLATPAAEELPTPSPDGRWLAYQTSASGTAETRVAPLTDLTAFVQVSTRGGSPIRWNRDGATLYFNDGDTIAAIDIGPRGPVLTSRRALFSVPRDSSGPPGRHARRRARDHHPRRSHLLRHRRHAGCADAKAVTCSPDRVACS